MTFYMKIQISCETSGANIYYTLDGSTPTKDKSLYTNELELSESCTVKAIGVKEGFRDSKIKTEEAVRRLPTPDIFQWIDSSMGWGYQVRNLNDYEPYIDQEAENIIFACKGPDEEYEVTAKKVSMSTLRQYSTSVTPQIGSEFSCYVYSTDNDIEKSLTTTIKIKNLSDCENLR